MYNKGLQISRDKSSSNQWRSGNSILILITRNQSPAGCTTAKPHQSATFHKQHFLIAGILKNGSGWIPLRAAG